MTPQQISYHSPTIAIPTREKISENKYDFDILQSFAKLNDTESIEYLFTLTCHQKSPEGKEAERFLFDLYTGKESGHSDLKKQLGKDSLRLYELIKARNNNSRRTNKNIYAIPEKILLMAAFEAANEAPLQNEIFDHLKNLDAFVLVDDSAHPATPSLFHTNRFITEPELSKISSILNQEQDKFYFHNARTIENVPNLDISHQDNQVLQDSHMRQFIPLLFRDHWILFGIFALGNQDKKAVVFDSLAYLNDDEKTQLHALARQYGVATNPPVTFFSKNLQENAPNACGLLVTKAMRSISKSPLSPINALEDFIAQFEQHDHEEQQLFNRNGRAEMLATLIEMPPD